MKMSEVNYEDLSPMMKQYYDIKKNYEGILLFYRLGDFYEMFFDDALIGSRELGLTLTGKNAGLSERIPMCGAPHHSIKGYIQEAVKRGFKVAICEQMEDSKESKGMVKREVIEVISKGTLTDLEFLDNKDLKYFGISFQLCRGICRHFYRRVEHGYDRQRRRATFECRLEQRIQRNRREQFGRR